MNEIFPDQLLNCPADYPRDLPAAEVRGRFLDLLGPFQQPSVPLKPDVTEEIELSGQVIRQRIEYDIAPGERVAAFHLFRKDLPADAPGILAIHAHGGDQIFPHGKAYHCHPVPDQPNQYGYHAAMAGFRVLAPDALCFGERQAKWGYARLFFDEINAHAELTARGLSLAWKSVWDNSRALEMLESLGAKRMGAIGHSGGSTQTYILAAVNEKVRAATCFASFMTLRHQFFQYRVCHCLYHFIPGMMQAGIDWDQVAALAAPMPLFMQRGTMDEGTPTPMYRAFVDAIESRCRQENLPGSVETFEEPAQGHDITDAGMKAGLAFLQRHV
ncbi:MAG: hypothetical protein IT440_01455 [Phycisphaeraceae bacterium]|nr:hypothetical protein [Phycisphaeraceae bacterium]